MAVSVTLMVAGIVVLAREVSGAAEVPPVNGAMPVPQPAAPVAPAATPGCVVDLTGLSGWWTGSNELAGRIGPALAGQSGFTNAKVGVGFAVDGGALLSTNLLPAATSEVSVEGWIKPVNTGQVQALFSRWTWVGGDSDDAFALFLGVNGELMWITDDTSTRSAVALTTTVPQLYDGQFHHVAATWSQSEMAVYVDGARVAVQPSQRGTLNAGTETEFRLGSSGGLGSPLYYNGVLDEPTVFGRALSPAEVAAIFQSGTEGKCPAPEPALDMGGPEAFMGQDPERGFNPQFVLNTGGWLTDKQYGDKRSAGQCGGSFAGCTPPNSASGVNTDYSANGYLYTVNVGATAAVGGQPLRFEIYDPAYVFNNDTCGVNGLSAAQAGTINTNHPGDPFALQRYQSGPTPWCMGDQRLSTQLAANGSAIVTTYIVRAPDDTPSDLNDNPAVCAISFDPYGDVGQGSQAGAVFDLLNNNTPRGRENVPFRDHYRKWFPICEIPAGSVQRGDYVLQIRTNADLSSPQRDINGGLAVGTGAGSLENAASPFPSTGGHNRYTMRTGFGNGALGAQSSLSTVPAASTTFGGVTLSAVGNLPIYMNQLGATAEIYLARITPEAAGKTLQLTFWDMGDAVSGSSTFSVVRGADAGGTPFTCAFSRDGQVPAPGVTISGCEMAGITYGNYNGRNVIVTIPIPSDYTCDAADLLGCWTKVRVGVVGSSRSDTSTWSAELID